MYPVRCKDTTAIPFNQSINQSINQCKHTRKLDLKALQLWIKQISFKIGFKWGRCLRRLSMPREIIPSPRPTCKKLSVSVVHKAVLGTMKLLESDKRSETLICWEEDLLRSTRRYWGVNAGIEEYMQVLRSTCRYWGVLLDIEEYMQVLRSTTRYWGVHAGIEEYMQVLKSTTRYWGDWWRSYLHTVSTTL